MPAPAPTPSGVLKAIFNVAGINSSCCFAYSGGAPSTADLATFAADLQGEYADHLFALLASGYDLESVKCLDLADPSTPAGSFDTPEPGTRSGTILPPSVTLLLNFEPDARYRGSKPKAWMPWGVEGDLASPKAWSSDFVDACNTGWAAFVAGVAGQSSGTTTLENQVSVSYFHGKEANPNPNSRLRNQPTPREVPAVYDISSFAARIVPGSQRRRL